MKLREYQWSIVDYIIASPRCNLFVAMGLGKTCSVLTALSHLSLVENVFPVLVVAPLRVASSTWPDEIKKWPHLHHLKVSVVVGTTEERTSALNKQADIYCINYDNLTWLDDKLAGKWRFKTIVADECSKLKGFRSRQGTKRSKSLAKHVHYKDVRYIGLTGTPCPNGLKDLWAITWFVDKGERLGRSFTAFQNRWFTSLRVGSDAHAVQIVPMQHAQMEIENKLRDVCLSLDAKNYFDIAEPIVNVIRVDLPPKARKLYKEMEKQMFMELECGTEIEAFNAASKTIKCLQLANGAVYTDETSTNFAEVHDAKIQALQSIVEEAAGAPILVAYHFKSDLARLQRAFTSGRELDADPRTISEWNQGGIQILFVHPASAGHGLNLQDGGNIIAFFGHWWDLEQYQQMIERIGPTRQAQAGHDRPVFIHLIVAADSVDEIVMARRDSKREVQDLLIESLKRMEL